MTEVAGMMAVSSTTIRGTPEAVTGSLTGGGTSPTVSPMTPNPMVTSHESEPHGLRLPGDLSACFACPDRRACPRLTTGVML